MIKDKLNLWRVYLLRRMLKFIAHELKDHILYFFSVFIILKLALFYLSIQNLSYWYVILNYLPQKNRERL